jgi:hypothetical protein
MSFGNRDGRTCVLRCRRPKPKRQTPEGENSAPSGLNSVPTIRSVQFSRFLRTSRCTDDAGSVRNRTG